MSDQSSNRQGKITPEHLAEAARLNALWQSTYGERKARGLHTQSAFGAEYDIGNQAAVGFFLNGKTALSLKAARGFAKGLGCDIGSFSPRLAAVAEGIAASVNPAGDEFVYVPHADVVVSAGHGAVVYEDGHRSSLSFRRDYLRKQGVSEKNAVVISVRGSSMEPLIDDGSVLLVNRAHASIVDGLVYAFRFDGELFVKRIFKAPGGYVARSENPDREMYPDIQIPEGRDDNVEMIGRAIWMGKKL